MANKPPDTKYGVNTKTGQRVPYNAADPTNLQEILLDLTKDPDYVPTDWLWDIGSEAILTDITTPPRQPSALTEARARTIVSSLTNEEIEAIKNDTLSDEQARRIESIGQAFLETVQRSTPEGAMYSEQIVTMPPFLEEAIKANATMNGKLSAIAERITSWSTGTSGVGRGGTTTPRVSGAPTDTSTTAESGIPANLAQLLPGLSPEMAEVTQNLLALEEGTLTSFETLYRDANLGDLQGFSGALLYSLERVAGITPGGFTEEAVTPEDSQGREALSQLQENMTAATMAARGGREAQPQIDMYRGMFPGISTPFSTSRDAVNKYRGLGAAAEDQVRIATREIERLLEEQAKGGLTSTRAIEVRDELLERRQGTAALIENIYHLDNIVRKFEAAIADREGRPLGSLVEENGGMSPEERSRADDLAGFSRGN